MKSVLMVRRVGEGGKAYSLVEQAGVLKEKLKERARESGDFG